jgi:hypothetical protein
MLLQLRLGHRAGSIGEQYREELERLRRQMHLARVQDQLPGVVVEREVAKSINHATRYSTRQLSWRARNAWLTTNRAILRPTSAPSSSALR